MPIRESDKLHSREMVNIMEDPNFIKRARLDFEMSLCVSYWYLCDYAGKINISVGVYRGIINHGI